MLRRFYKLLFSKIKINKDEMLKNFQKNILYIYIISFFNALAISWDVIYILFLQRNLLSFFQIGILFSIGTLTFLLSEILSGIFSDKYGRKRSLMFSNFFFFIGSFIFFLTNSFIFFIFASIFIALGSSFWSGTIDSLLYESLKKLKREKNYEKVLSRNYFIFVSTGIVTNFLVPLIFKYQIKLPFFIGMIFISFVFFLTLFLTESLDKIKIKKSIFLEYKNQFEIIWKVFFKNKTLIWVILFSGIIGLPIALFGDILNQPLIRNIYPLEEYGLIFSLATIIQSIFLFKLEKIIKFTRKFNVYWSLIIMWTISLFLLFLVLNNIWLLILVMGFIWMMGSFRGVFISSEINKEVKEDSLRSTTHSANAMFSALIFLIISPLFGILLDFITLKEGILFLAINSFIFGGIILLFKRK